MSDPLARLGTALPDRYRIERELGEGGMATVYLAQDLKHDLGAGRFLREIQLAAKLAHPHILPLFDSGGMLYCVMPCIDGQSLRGRLEDRASRGEYVPAFTQLAIHVGLGDLPAMRREFAASLEEITPVFSFRVTSGVFLDAYEDDPEIARLYRQLYQEDEPGLAP